MLNRLACAAVLAPLFMSAAFVAGPLLDPKLSWHGDNRAKLEELIRTHGKGSKGYDAAKKPVAVFDWDNTVIKGDVGDATLYWMLAHDLIHRPSGWSATSPLLTPEAVAALERDCPKTLPDPLPTSKTPACTDTILSIYEGALPGSKTSAWRASHDHDLIEPAYGWAVQLMQGHTPGEMRRIADAVIGFNLGNELSAKQKLGTREYAAGIRIYDPIRDLIHALQKGGIDVWIASASSQHIVEVFAKRVGIARDHVIGVRSALDAKGRLTAGFESCGVYPKGNGDIISYRLGKRCWINQVIFGIKDPKRMIDMPSPTLFAAGDSDTDVFFLKDAKLRLVINRNKRELMCRAYAQDGGPWLINPMFIEPKARLATGYQCQDFGLPDQADSVY